MKKAVFIMMLSTSFLMAQNKKNIWQTALKTENTVVQENKKEITNPTLVALDIDEIKSILELAPSRFDTNKKALPILSFPNQDGEMIEFRIAENSIMEPSLAAKYPEIKSYIGIGVKDPRVSLYFSLSPLGFQSMQLNADRSTVFIEPYTTDLSSYVVYKRTEKSKSFSPFECKVISKLLETESNEMGEDPSNFARPNADDSTLRTFRLAVSTTGEYTAYFGGTKALAMAAINTTMVRVNGVFEKDFAVRMVLIANNDLVVYTDAATDPYTTSYNSQVQSTLTSVIGEANYDVGHLFVRASNNGNAGCIGCVCVNGSKGSAFTSGSVPTGDIFDIDYVAHEIGHQFGGNHTFSHNNEGTGANMEPGSGSTIMGYAGITGQDVQPNSDVYFHAFSIQQITNNVKNKTCQTNTPTGNDVPTANAGLDYTIPRSTPFMLTGSGTDINGDSLTYNWEQFDSAASTATGANSAASATRTSGPTFRSYTPTASPIRYFPRMQSILAGATTTAGTEITVEALPSVARTLNFRLTVSDNRLNGAANNSDDTVITVNGTAGPFSVTSPNSAIQYLPNSTQTVTWNVAGTTANGVNCANVDILISTDGGTTWSTLLAATPNDGSQAVTMPNTLGSTNRIMVKGTNHIFFDISNTNFTITNSIDTTPPTAPTLSASGTTSTTTNLSWTGATDNVGIAGYDVYRGGTLIASDITTTTFTVTGLVASTSYTFTVRAKDGAGNVSPNSNTVSITTLYATYCNSQGNSVADELIGRVQFGTIDNVSTGGTGYTDFTSISTTITRGTTQTITITPTWTGSVFNEGYAVFIDYNRDGDFVDSGETVWSRTPTNITPVSGTFTIPASATIGNTRMRVSLKYNGIPTSCETFSYGQVEDYTIIFVADTNAPSAPVLTATNTTQTSTDLSWTASNDNVGVVGYDIYEGVTLIGSTTSATTFLVTGLTPSTTYNYTVRAKDAVGNVSLPSNTVTVITTSSSTSTVNVKLFIEGYYDATTNSMRPVKANQGVGSSSTIVDDITLELRNTSNILIDTANGVLHTDGTATCTFNSVPSGNYYLVIKHRNSIETWSATTQSISASPLTYDFSNAVNKSFGSNMIQVSTGVYAIYSGDLTQDGFVDLIDYSVWESDYNNSSTGYLLSDINGDGFTDLLDYSIWEGNYNISMFSSSPF